MMDERVTAIVRLACTAVADVAACAGYALDADAIACAVLSVLACACTLWSWWKNNNLTSAAQTAQAWLDELKDGAGEDGDGSEG